MLYVVTVMRGLMVMVQFCCYDDFVDGFDAADMVRVVG
jgi:uncharacterized membrane protein YqhA